MFYGPVEYASVEAAVAMIVFCAILIATVAIHLLFFEED